MVQSCNPFFIVTLAPLFAALWVYLGRRGKEPLTPVKFSLGLFQAGLSFWFLKLGVEKASTNGMTSMIWLLLAYLFQATGELCISPVGLSMVTKLAPARFASFMMGSLFLSIAFAAFMAQQIAKYFSSAQEMTVISSVTDKAASLAVFDDIFQFLVYFPVAAALIMLLLSPVLKGVFARHQ